HGRMAIVYLHGNWLKREPPKLYGCCAQSSCEPGNRCGLQIETGRHSPPYAAQPRLPRRAMRSTMIGQACGGARASKTRGRGFTAAKSLSAPCRAPTANGGSGIAGVAGGTMLPARLMSVQMPQ